MPRTRIFIASLIAILIIGLFAACGREEQSAAPAEVAEPAADAVTEVAEAAAQETSPLAPDAFTIALEPIGHWHVTGTKKLLFTVNETASEAGKTGLNLVVQIARAGTPRITERSVEAEQIQEEGDGIYSLDYTASSIGAYALVARFNYEGQEFVSAPVSFEVARDGEEGIRVDAQDSAYVYQIRYNWEPGHIHANDEEPVKLIFEILRGIPQGDEINWEQPWQNAFDHVTNAETPVVVVESTEGGVSEKVEPVYLGRGIYEAERVFPEAEVGEGLDYEVQFTFTDPYNGAEVTHSEPYVLHAVPGH